MGTAAGNTIQRRHWREPSTTAIRNRSPRTAFERAWQEHDRHCRGEQRAFFLMCVMALVTVPAMFVVATGGPAGLLDSVIALVAQVLQ